MGKDTMRTTLSVWATVLVMAATCPAHAQLVSDEIRDDQRICTYVGSEQLTNDTVAPRTLTTSLAQPCPATPPYRDPNQRPPDNAALRAETTNAANRLCTYEQGGIEYQLSVPIAVRCAQTPALLERDAER